jgi:mgtE-like transporter
MSVAIDVITTTSGGGANATTDSINGNNNNDDDVDNTRSRRGRHHHRRPRLTRSGTAPPPFVDGGQLLRQVLPPLLVSALISLVPGYLIAANEATWQRVPGLLVLVPALIGMRGNVFGSLASRLSVELQTAKHSRFTMSRLLTFLDRYIMVEVLLLSAALALMSRLFNGSAVVLHDLLFNSLVNGVVSGSLMLVATKLIVAVAVYIRVDPDNIAPIVVTSLGDTLTIPVILFISTVLLERSSHLVQNLVVLALLLAGAAIGLKLWLRETLFSSMALQRVPVLLCCMLASFMSGVVMERLLSHEAGIGHFLVLVPLMNSQGGSIGSCVSSRLATRQQRAAAAHRQSDGGGGGGGGENESDEDEGDGLDFFDVLLQTFVLIGATTIVLSVVGLALFLHLFSSVTHLLVIMSTMAIVLTSTSTLIAMLAIQFAARFRLHPANVTIPIVCAVMDAVASYSFFILIQ